MKACKELEIYAKNVSEVVVEVPDIDEETEVKKEVVVQEEEEEEEEIEEEEEDEDEDEESEVFEIILVYIQSLVSKYCRGYIR